MGSALYSSLFNDELPKVALLNIGIEENKGNNILKKTHLILKSNNVKNLRSNNKSSNWILWCCIFV